MVDHRKVLYRLVLFDRRKNIVGNRMVLQDFIESLYIKSNNNLIIMVSSRFLLRLDENE